MFPILIIFLVASGCIALYFVQHKKVMQLGIYFNFCALAYMVFGLTIIRVDMLKAYAFELEQIGWMSVAAVIGFNLAYMIARVPPYRAVRRSPDYLPSHTTLLFIVGIGLAFELAAILLIGPLDFILSDRIQRFAIVTPRKALFFMANVMNVCLPIVMLRYFNYKQRRDRTLFYFLVCHGLFLGIVTISRYDLSILVLCLLYFFERNGNLRPHVVLVVLLLAFVSTMFFKPVFYQILLDQSYIRLTDINEYSNWIRHTVLLMTRPEVELPHNGYVLALKSLLVISPEQDALSEWFFREFFPERVVLFPGLGYGFSGVWQGYTANGLIGVALQFAFFGALFGLLERSPTAMRHVFIVFAMILTYRLFRSEVYNFIKTYAWYFAYPTFAIVIADKFMNWASKQREEKTLHFHREQDSSHQKPGRNK